jgi:hypothetical protein
VRSRSDPATIAARARRAALAATLVVLVAACGSGSATRFDGSAAGRNRASRAAAPQSPVGRGAARRPTRGERRPDRSVARPDLISPRHAPARARYPTPEDDEVNASGAETPNPCRLVTKREAHAILGAPIAELREAPLGPTCIYRPQRAKRFITLAVQSTGLTATKRRGRDLIRVTLRGHKAYCQKYGSLMTVVPLRGGKVLSITGPCPIAARFASKALTRLG